MGGLHEFMGWRRPIITDSGGYQVFSMGHGSVAEEIKRRRERRESMVARIEEEGVRFRSYLDGAERFMGPETSMEVQAALGSDIALAFDECTPFHVERDYTAARWSAPTAGSTAASPGTRARAAGPAPVRDRAGRRLRGPARRVDRLRGRRRGGRDRDRRLARAGEGADARGGGLGAARLPEERPRHLLGIGDVDDLVHAVGAGIDTFDCATPTRLARHGTALVRDPRRRWRLDLTKGEHRTSREPIARGCACPACREHTRGYLHYLIRAGELTGKRLLTLHNLTFMADLMRGLREAIEAGTGGTRPRAPPSRIAER